MTKRSMLAANIGFFQKMYGVTQKSLMALCGIRSDDTWRKHVYDEQMTVEELKIVAKELGTTPDRLLREVKL